MCATLSQTLDNTGNSDIGLLLFGTSSSPSLGIGVTTAIFHIFGKIALSKVALIIEVIEGNMAGRQSLMTRIGTLSMPGALFEAIDFTIDSTWLCGTALKVNWSGTPLYEPYQRYVWP